MPLIFFRDENRFLHPRSKRLEQCSEKNYANDNLPIYNIVPTPVPFKRFEPNWNVVGIIEARQNNQRMVVAN